MAGPFKTLINCDPEQARLSREWQANKAQKKQERKSRKAQQQAAFDAQRAIAIAAGVPVQQIPIETRKPRDITSRQARALRKHNRQEATALKYREDIHYRPGMKSEFYQTRQWRELRWKVLVKHGAVCNMCGITREHGAIMHVDHIKPRSKFPALELVFDNLQVLCEDCNIGKSNT